MEVTLFMVLCLCVCGISALVAVACSIGDRSRVGATVAGTIASLAILVLFVVIIPSLAISVSDDATEERIVEYENSDTYDLIRLGDADNVYLKVADYRYTFAYPDGDEIKVQDSSLREFGKYTNVTIRTEENAKPTVTISERFVIHRTHLLWLFYYDEKEKTVEYTFTLSPDMIVGPSAKN